jgi:4-diphosphocytidyl-2-C-methyl-D-erythritol kinase
VLSIEEMHGVASGLGADVPFFLLDAVSAIGTGTGTELTPVTFDPFYFLLLLPDFGVSTAWAYSQCHVTSQYGYIDDVTKVEEGLLWQNDLEEPVFKRYPVLAEVKEQLLNNGAIAAMMSGSGSTMFGVFKTGDAARNAGDRLSLPASWRSIVTHSS